MQISSGDVSFEATSKSVWIIYFDKDTEIGFSQEISLNEWKKLVKIISQLADEVERGLKGEV